MKNEIKKTLGNSSSIIGMDMLSKAERCDGENMPETIETSEETTSGIYETGRTVKDVEMITAVLREDMMRRLRTMDVDSTIGCPITKISSVRSQASQVGLELNRKYKTRADRDRRVVWVTRIS